MARQPRFQYPGAVYHVMARGNGGDAVFVTDDGSKLGQPMRTERSTKRPWRRSPFTSVSNAWIAERLAMGHPGSVGRSVSAGRSTKETLKNADKLGKLLKCGTLTPFIDENISICISFVSCLR